MRHFALSYLVTGISLLLSWLWAGWNGLMICALLTVMEVSFSFDNAVVNATVMRHMNALWQRRFLTWGMLITVAGMYYLFPLVIVAAATGNSLFEVARMAVYDQQSYSEHVMNAHAQISAFGGMFLLMVFLTFIFNDSKELHWLGRIERQLARLGQLEAVEVVVALAILLILQTFLPMDARLPALIAGVSGVALYVAIHSVTSLFGTEKRGTSHTALAGFIYLNLLDASFSLDAVVGSFAISSDIIIILLGLSAGAMFVRSMTVYLVQKGTLSRYVFLEHGAHYGIGSLAVIMLIDLIFEIPGTITGLIGLVFILLSLVSSVKYNHRKDHKKNKNSD